MLKQRNRKARKSFIERKEDFESIDSLAETELLEKDEMYHQNYQIREERHRPSYQNYYHGQNRGAHFVNHQQKEYGQFSSHYRPYSVSDSRQRSIDNDKEYRNNPCNLDYYMAPRDDPVRGNSGNKQRSSSPRRSSDSNRKEYRRDSSSHRRYSDSSRRSYRSSRYFRSPRSSTSGYSPRNTSRGRSREDRSRSNSSSSTKSTSISSVPSDSPARISPDKRKVRIVDRKQTRGYLTKSIVSQFRGKNFIDSSSGYNRRHIKPNTDKTKVEVTIGDLTMSPISSDDFSQHSEMIESEEDMENIEGRNTNINVKIDALTDNTEYKKTKDLSSNTSKNATSNDDSQLEHKNETRLCGNEQKQEKNSSENNNARVKNDTCERAKYSKSNRKEFENEQSDYKTKSNLNIFNEQKHTNQVTKVMSTENESDNNEIGLSKSDNMRLAPVSIQATKNVFVKESDYVKDNKEGKTETINETKSKTMKNGSFQELKKTLLQTSMDCEMVDKIVSFMANKSKGSEEPNCSDDSKRLEKQGRASLVHKNTSSRIDVLRSEVENCKEKKNINENKGSEEIIQNDHSGCLKINIGNKNKPYTEKSMEMTSKERDKHLKTRKLKIDTSQTCIDEHPLTKSDTFTDHKLQKYAPKVKVTLKNSQKLLIDRNSVQEPLKEGRQVKFKKLDNSVTMKGKLSKTTKDDSKDSAPHDLDQSRSHTLSLSDKRKCFEERIKSNDKNKNQDRKCDQSNKKDCIKTVNLVDKKLIVSLTRIDEGILSQQLSSPKHKSISLTEKELTEVFESERTSQDLRISVKDSNDGTRDQESNKDPKRKSSNENTETRKYSNEQRNPGDIRINKSSERKSISVTKASSKRSGKRKGSEDLEISNGSMEDFLYMKDRNPSEVVQKNVDRSFSSVEERKDFKEMAMVTERSDKKIKLSGNIESNDSSERMLPDDIQKDDKVKERHMSSLQQNGNVKEMEISGFQEKYKVKDSKKIRGQENIKINERRMSNVKEHNMIDEGKTTFVDEKTKEIKMSSVQGIDKMRARKVSSVKENDKVKERNMTGVHDNDNVKGKIMTGVEEITKVKGSNIYSVQGLDKVKERKISSVQENDEVKERFMSGVREKDHKIKERRMSGNQENDKEKDRKKSGLKENDDEKNKRMSGVQENDKVKERKKSAVKEIDIEKNKRTSGIQENDKVKEKKKSEGNDNRKKSGLKENEDENDRRMSGVQENDKVKERKKSAVKEIDIEKDKRMSGVQENDKVKERKKSSVKEIDIQKDRWMSCVQENDKVKERKKYEVNENDNKKDNKKSEVNDNEKDKRMSGFQENDKVKERKKSGVKEIDIEKDRWMSCIQENDKVKERKKTGVKEIDNEKDKRTSCILENDKVKEKKKSEINDNEKDKRMSGVQENDKVKERKKSGVNEIDIEKDKRTSGVQENDKVKEKKKTKVNDNEKDKRISGIQENDKVKERRKSGVTKNDNENDRRMTGVQKKYKGKEIKKSEVNENDNEKDKRVSGVQENDKVKDRKKSGIKELGVEKDSSMFGIQENKLKEREKSKAKESYNEKDKRMYSIQNNDKVKERVKAEVKENDNEKGRRMSSVLENDKVKERKRSEVKESDKVNEKRISGAHGNDKIIKHMLSGVNENANIKESKFSEVPGNEKVKERRISSFKENVKKKERKISGVNENDKVKEKRNPDVHENDRVKERHKSCVQENDTVKDRRMLGVLENDWINGRKIIDVQEIETVKERGTSGVQEIDKVKGRPASFVEEKDKVKERDMSDLQENDKRKEGNVSVQENDSKEKMFGIQENDRIKERKINYAKIIDRVIERQMSSVQEIDNVKERKMSDIQQNNNRKESKMPGHENYKMKQSKEASVKELNKVKESKVHSVHQNEGINSQGKVFKELDINDNFKEKKNSINSESNNKEVRHSDVKSNNSRERSISCVKEGYEFEENRLFIDEKVKTSKSSKITNYNDSQQRKDSDSVENNNLKERRLSLGSNDSKERKETEILELRKSLERSLSGNGENKKFINFKDRRLFEIESSDLKDKYMSEAIKHSNLRERRPSGVIDNINSRERRHSDVLDHSNTRKRHGSESASPVIVKGTTNRPSFGLYIPLGRPTEKHKSGKQMINPPVADFHSPVLQEKSVPIKEKESSHEDVVKGKVHESVSEESQKKEMLGDTHDTEPKRSLFSKNKRRISHCSDKDAKYSKTSPDNQRKLSSPLLKDSSAKKMKTSDENERKVTQISPMQKESPAKRTKLSHENQTKLLSTLKKDSPTNYRSQHPFKKFPINRHLKFSPSKQVKDLKKKSAKPNENKISNTENKIAEGRHVLFPVDNIFEKLNESSLGKDGDDKREDSQNKPVLKRTHDDTNDTFDKRRKHNETISKNESIFDTVKETNDLILKTWNVNDDKQYDGKYKEKRSDQQKPYSRMNLSKRKVEGYLSDNTPSSSSKAGKHSEKNHNALQLSSLNGSKVENHLAMEIDMKKDREVIKITKGYMKHDNVEANSYDLDNLNETVEVIPKLKETTGASNSGMKEQKSASGLENEQQAKTGIDVVMKASGCEKRVNAKVKRLFKDKQRKYNPEENNANIDNCETEEGIMKGYGNYSSETKTLKVKLAKSPLREKSQDTEGTMDDECIYKEKAESCQNIADIIDEDNHTGDIYFRHSAEQIGRIENEMTLRDDKNDNGEDMYELKDANSREFGIKGDKYIGNLVYDQIENSNFICETENSDTCKMKDGKTCTMIRKREETKSDDRDSDMNDIETVKYKASESVTDVPTKENHESIECKAQIDMECTKVCHRTKFIDDFVIIHNCVKHDFVNPTGKGYKNELDVQDKRVMKEKHRENRCAIEENVICDLINGITSNHCYNETNTSDENASSLTNIPMKITPRKKFASQLDTLGKKIEEENKNERSVIRENKEEEIRQSQMLQLHKVPNTEQNDDDNDDDADLISGIVELTPSKQRHSSNTKTTEWLKKAKSNVKVPTSFKTHKSHEQERELVTDCVTTGTISGAKICEKNQNKPKSTTQFFQPWNETITSKSKPVNDYSVDNIYTQITATPDALKQTCQQDSPTNNLLEQSNSYQQQSMTTFDEGSTLSKSIHTCNSDKKEKVPLSLQNVSTVPMFNPLTAKLMDESYSVETKDNYANIKYQSEPSVVNNDQTISQLHMSLSLDIHQTVHETQCEIENSDQMTKNVNSSMAVGQLEIQDVREPGKSYSKRREAGICQEPSLVKEKSVRPRSNSAREVVTDADNRRIALYRELCDLDNINTGDAGLDVMLLAEKSYLRGMMLIDKEILQHAEPLSEKKRQKDQKKPRPENDERKQNIEERVNYLGQLKKGQR